MALPSIEEVESGSCILFLGAGYSPLATNLDDQTIKRASELKSQLLSESGIADSDDYDLESAAEEFVIKFGEQKLQVYCIEIFNQKQ